MKKLLLYVLVGPIIFYIISLLFGGFDDLTRIGAYIFFGISWGAFMSSLDDDH